MARKPRRYQIERSLVFHIINRGILKQAIFHDEEDFSAFVESVYRYVSRAGASVYHWCLMNNHYHIVMELPDPTELSKVVGGWQHVYAVRYHRRYQTAGKLFQSRFKSQAIEKGPYLMACGRYVEQNPVRAGLCERAWDWIWSSAKFYVEGKPDLLTTLDPLWEGSDGEVYKRWLMEQLPQEEKLFRSSKEVVGGPRLQKELLRRSGRLVRRGKGRRFKEIK